MKHLATLHHDPDLSDRGRVLERLAVKAVIARGRELLLLHVPATGEYKFPGGGVHPGESPEGALARELAEECGATLLEVSGEYGEVVELSRPLEAEFDVFRMTSRYYTCRVADGLSGQALDAYEEALGLTPRWVNLGEAIGACRAVASSGEHAPRWVRRELLVLQDLEQRWAQEAGQGSAC